MEKLLLTRENLLKLLEPIYRYINQEIEKHKQLQEEQVRIARLKQYELHERRRRGESKEGVGLIDFNPDTCTHLKGGKNRPHHTKDYSIGTHTFIDGHTEIFCTICKKTWTKNSPDWKQAIEMAKQSSNRPSSSERLFKQWSRT